MGSEIIEFVALFITFLLMLYLAYLLGRIRENIKMIRMIVLLGNIILNKILYKYKSYCYN